MQYLLGDNRADSCDSRYWGPIKGSSIVGKVVLTFWHRRPPRLPQVLILAAPDEDRQRPFAVRGCAHGRCRCPHAGPGRR